MSYDISSTSMSLNSNSRFILADDIEHSMCYFTAEKLPTYKQYDDFNDFNDH